ncbi:MAG: M48 family metalloprotease [Myxococcaceae bacterium]|nr:M48 family metalloprotease [Myxococcaceae bacterium]
MTEAIFTPQQLAEIEAYHRPYYFWAWAGLVVNLAITAAVFRFVIGPLYARCERVKPPSKVLAKVWLGDGWAAALLFSLAYFALMTLTALPVDVWFQLHEHAFGLSKYTPATYAIDYGKNLVLSIGAFSALTFGLFGLARRVRSWWVLLGAVGALVLLFSAALDPYRSRLYFEQKPLPPGELRERITTLMAKANIDFRDVLIEDNGRATVKLQAYFAGRGPTRTIVLNESLLKELSTDEILAAVAHEAGHVQESRWPGSIASAVTLFLFLFAVDVLLRWVAKRGFWGVTERADIRALPLVFVMFWLGTTLATPVSAAFSRERERKADAFGLELTRDREAFVSMLTKAARVNKMDPDPPRWVVLKGRTHPTIRERLEAVERWRPAKADGG